jgi:hypothetical protein
MIKMARKSNAKPKVKIGKEGSPSVFSSAVAGESSDREIRDTGPMTPNFYTDVVQSVFERNRKRVSTYYCPNIACRKTFWDAAEGYACPACGTLGIISEFKYRSFSNGTSGRNIVGYVDTVGRLICSNCILNFGVQNEIGLIVYDDTEPFCHEHCELCKEPMGQLQS